MKIQPCTNVIVIWTLRVWNSRRCMSTNTILQSIRITALMTMMTTTTMTRENFTLFYTSSRQHEEEKISFFCRKNEQHIPPFFVQERRYHFSSFLGFGIIKVVKEHVKKLSIICKLTSSQTRKYKRGSR